MSKLDQLLHPAEHDPLSHQRDGQRGFPYRKLSFGSATAFQPHASQDRPLASPSGFDDWAKGLGMVEHSPPTLARIHSLLNRLNPSGKPERTAQILKLLHAADRLCNAAMWLVVHMTYAQRVRLDGEALQAADFKPTPEGHTGGALNMVPAYVGYLLANALSGQTRGWLMGQGHCVAAIDAVNVLVGNLHPEQAERYELSDAGLSQLCQDFYSYALDGDGLPAAPLGSHVNAHTAGGLIEGGYLGFAELQYVHMPLPGESLVAFLSDGAFEEQRGSDWAPRWWRAEDCGAALPVMILNGRRIEQRSGLEQDGGVAWFIDHLLLNGFDPVEIDGTDPAAFAWAILHMEDALAAQAEAIQNGDASYPARLPYAIAHAPKGFGFPGAGSNLAHNLPLGANPSQDEHARQRFNSAAAKLWVNKAQLNEAVLQLHTHTAQQRPLERDNPLTQRRPILHPAPLPWHAGSEQIAHCSPMAGFDAAFCAIAQANPQLRIRIGNPDELRSNGMGKTLDHFYHRATHPEAQAPEHSTGAVITALNEEAVISAALANKGGLNLAVSYEAFAVKMLGALRQEVLFARHQAEAGRAPGWLSVPVLLSSHAWENGKNELSHQDTTLPEAWLGEMSDRARVVFPPDWNSALATLEACYQTRGQIWCVVAPKRAVPTRLNQEQAQQMVRDGLIRLVGSGAADEELILVAVGAYQLTEMQRASNRLAELDIAHSLIYVYEPGRLREPRDVAEASITVSQATIGQYFPHHLRKRVLLGHTRPEALIGAMRRIDTGPEHTAILGFRNRGGTLDSPGMLFANGCSWAHVLDAVGKLLRLDPGVLLTEDARNAVLGVGDPAELR